MPLLQSGKVRLCVLTLGHAFVDCYGGFLAPLLPALARHLNVDLATLAILSGFVGLLVNGIQPLAGHLIARQKFPIFLIGGPLLATVITLMGLTHSFAIFAALCFVSCVGIGIYHPEALLVAHDVSGDHEHIGVPFFLSGGFFGFSVAGVAATQWVAHFGFEGIWLLAIPGLLITLFIYLSGLPRLALHPSVHSEEENSASRFGFGPLLVMSCLLTSSVSILFTFLNAHLEALYGVAGFKAGGMALFLMGMTGALSSYGWGWLSRRFSRFGLLAAGQAAALPLYLLLIRSASPRQAIFWSIPTGVFIGSAVFPLVATAARQSRGLTPGLRAGLVVGGAWGFGALMTIFAGYANKFGATVPQILNAGAGFIPLTIIVSLVMARQEARSVRSMPPP
ncbi:MAG: MFS transporter [Verrucomicrobiae bacterium]|nr:MFS transporter [Verrucomicrobiae bacterium]